jgi:hypothetical protein
MLRILDAEGYMLIVHSHGTFVAFASNCELEIVGSW